MSFHDNELTIDTDPCEDCPAPGPEMQEVGLPTWCDTCEGRGWTYTLDYPSSDEALLGVAQLLDFLTRDCDLGESLNRDIGRMVKDLNEHRTDMAVSAAEARDEDGLWRAGCG